MSDEQATVPVIIKINCPVDACPATMKAEFMRGLPKDISERIIRSRMLASMKKDHRKGSHGR